MIRPLLNFAALAAAATLALSGSADARTGTPAIQACGYPASICSADEAVTHKANLFEIRTQQLEQEVRLKVDPKLQSAHAASCAPSHRRIRDRWSQIEAKALALAHLSTEDLNQLIARARHNLDVAIRRSPHLSTSERSHLLSKVETVQVRLPSESTQPFTAARHCGNYGSELQAFAGGVEQSNPEVVLCPGLLLLENLTPEHELWVTGGIPSPIQTVIAHEFAHHFAPADGPTSGQTLLRNCLVETLGIVDRQDQLNEVVADFWASEMMSVAIENPLEPRKAVHQSLILATLPVCILEQRLPPEQYPGASTDSHFRALARMTLSLRYHPRIQDKMGCEPFTVDHPTCDLGGTFPK